MIKSKCCNDNVFVKIKGSQTGLYCSSCGKWVKWANKDDINLISESKERVYLGKIDIEPLKEIKCLIDKIEEQIELEDKNLPKSDIDAVRKSSKVYELSRVKFSLENILNGKHYNED